MKTRKTSVMLALALSAAVSAAEVPTLQFRTYPTGASTMPGLSAVPALRGAWQVPFFDDTAEPVWFSPFAGGSNSWTLVGADGTSASASGDSFEFSGFTPGVSYGLQLSADDGTTGLMALHRFQYGEPFAVSTGLSWDPMRFQLYDGLDPATADATDLRRVLGEFGRLDVLLMLWQENPAILDTLTDPDERRFFEAVLHAAALELVYWPEHRLVHGMHKLMMGMLVFLDPYREFLHMEAEDSVWGLVTNPVGNLVAPWQHHLGHMQLWDALVRPDADYASYLQHLDALMAVLADDWVATDYGWNAVRIDVHDRNALAGALLATRAEARYLAQHQFGSATGLVMLADALTRETSVQDLSTLVTGADLTLDIADIQTDVLSAYDSLDISGASAGIVAGHTGQDAYRVNSFGAADEQLLDLLINWPLVVGQGEWASGTSLSSGYAFSKIGLLQETAEAYDPATGMTSWSLAVRSDTVDLAYAAPAEPWGIFEQVRIDELARMMTSEAGFEPATLLAAGSPAILPDADVPLSAAGTLIFSAEQPFNYGYDPTHLGLTQAQVLALDEPGLPGRLLGLDRSAWEADTSAARVYALEEWINDNRSDVDLGLYRIDLNSGVVTQRRFDQTLFTQQTQDQAWTQVQVLGGNMVLNRTEESCDVEGICTTLSHQYQWFSDIDSPDGSLSPVQISASATLSLLAGVQLQNSDALHIDAEQSGLLTQWQDNVFMAADAGNVAVFSVNAAPVVTAYDTPTTHLPEISPKYIALVPYRHDAIPAEQRTTLVMVDTAESRVARIAFNPAPSGLDGPNAIGPVDYSFDLHPGIAADAYADRSMMIAAGANPNTTGSYWYNGSRFVQNRVDTSDSIELTLDADVNGFTPVSRQELGAIPDGSTFVYDAAYAAGKLVYLEAVQDQTNSGGIFPYRLHMQSVDSLEHTSVDLWDFYPPDAQAMPMDPMWEDAPWNPKLTAGAFHFFYRHDTLLWVFDLNGTPLNSNSPLDLKNHDLDLMHVHIIEAAPGRFFLGSHDEMIEITLN